MNTQQEKVLAQITHPTEQVYFQQNMLLQSYILSLGTIYKGNCLLYLYIYSILFYLFSIIMINNQPVASYPALTNLHLGLVVYLWLYRCKVPYQMDGPRSNQLWHLLHKIRRVVIWCPSH